MYICAGIGQAASPKFAAVKTFGVWYRGRASG